MGVDDVNWPALHRVVYLVNSWVASGLIVACGVLGLVGNLEWTLVTMGLAVVMLRLAYVARKRMLRGGPP